MFVKRLGWTLALVMGVLAAAPAMAADSDATLFGLRCESLTDPMGIDVAQPRLSWKMEAPGRGRTQTAYQILVASTPAKLAADQGDLWDSGMVTSAQSIQIPYAGAPLTSHQDCWWKVAVLDNNLAIARSQPAHFSMGILTQDEWKAKWIGLDGGDEAQPGNGDVVDANWIWFNEGTPESSAAVGTCYFRKAFEIPAGREVVKSTVYAVGDNQGSVFLNNKHIGDFNTFKSATKFSLRKAITGGQNILAVSVDNAGPNANPAGLLLSVRIEFKEGDTLVLLTGSDWLASTTEAKEWKTPAFDDSAWTPAKELGKAGMEPWGMPAMPQERILPARMLRREFDGGEVKRAMAYISGLGLFELYVNGNRIGDHVLAPGCTEYNKRAFYVAFDVTDKLAPGKNAVGVMLGNGRYYAPRIGEPTTTRTYGYPKLLFHLRMEMADGSVREVVSDESWKLTTEGPIRANNEYDGEVYDARMEMPGWDKPGFDDSKWQAVQLVEKPGEALSAQMAEPIKVTEVLKPIGISNPLPGTYIYDMGQNMVGWCRIKVKGPAGTRVSLRHAEVLHDDGTLYLDNIRGAKVTDEYVLKGTGEEVYEPRFTYHGFRFVEVTGYPGQPELTDLEGCEVHDAVTPAGSFESSNKLLNNIYKNVVWGVRDNYRSMPTDCPQRDERQGWLGDRSEESRGESYLFDTANLYAKWICDMHDAQREDGSVSDVCPSYWPLYNDNVTWPSSFVIIPAMLYGQYGDARVIERHYDGMKLWIDYMTKYLVDDIMPRDNYGDWCVPPEEQHLIHSKDPARQTPGDFLGTSYFYWDLKLMAQYAEMLQKPEDAKAFLALAERLKTAFNKKFFNADEVIYANGAATTCVLPLAFGLV
ncbi:MAG: family 78 glycoside hydrolase catalytic domain, partial [FCB group bacterium]|nr:family 78 glycoside hydrolase catalytic domain [FCB group bacterium]